MDATTADMSTDSLSDGINLATWSRQRTMEEMRSFVNARHALLPDTIDIE